MPLNAEKMPVALYQTPRRAACSDFLYHWLVMRTKPGEIDDSSTPRKTRCTTRPSYDVQTMVRSAVTPQRKLRATSTASQPAEKEGSRSESEETRTHMQTLNVLASGKRCRRRANGKTATM